MVTSGLALVAFFVVIVLAPLRESAIVKVVLPERQAEIIQAELIPEPPPVVQEKALEQMAVERVADALPENPPDHLSLPQPKTHRDEVDPDAGKKGREAAQR